MKKLICIFILLSSVCYGQDTLQKKIHLSNGALIINAGIGFSTIQWAVSGISNSANTSPVYSGTLDYGFDNLFSIGVGVAQQSIDIIPICARTNTAIRILAYDNGNNIFDFYTGFRVGVSFWTGNPSLNTLNVPLGKNNTYMSFQALSGARVFISNIVGVHIEAGLGTPYFFEGGLTMRINTH